MSHEAHQSKRVLSPEERIAEVLFGLIMVITFTGSLSIAKAGRDDVRAMLIGAIGCNLAWGIIDAVMYLMSCLAEKARDLRTLHALRHTNDARAAHRIIVEALPPSLAAVLHSDEFTAIHERMRKLPEPPSVAKLAIEDWRGALGVFLLVFLATFPVAIPFLLFDSVIPALHMSNTIAIIMLFILGFLFGRITGRNPWFYAVSMVILGGALVLLTRLLGG
jgi:uncharacterized membrane protein